MDSIHVSSLFEALASETRLEIFRLLVKRAPEGMVAGELAQALELPPNNLSFHLRALARRGLIRVERKGRFMRYRANIPLMLGMIAYLTEECCSGDRAACQRYRQASAVDPKLLPELDQ